MAASRFKGLPWDRVRSRCHPGSCSVWSGVALCGLPLKWQTASDLDVDYVVSSRLYNAEGEMVYQEDEVLWNPEHWPTSHWSGDVPVDTLSLLNIPPNLPAGEYALRLVVYNFETLVPTVEIGVWEPEMTLAPVAFGGSSLM